MNKSEKQARIKHLSRRFYDMGAVPSILLSNEMHKTGITDDVLVNAVQELESLQVAAYKLTDKFSTTMAYELRQLKRIFEYENAQLAKKQDAEKLHYMNKKMPIPRYIQEDQYAARESLRRDQIARKTSAMEPANTALQTHQDKIYSVFMDAIRHLYR